MIDDWTRRGSQNLTQITRVEGVPVALGKPGEAKLPGTVPLNVSLGFSAGKVTVHIDDREPLGPFDSYEEAYQAAQKAVFPRVMVMVKP